VSGTPLDTATMESVVDILRRGAMAVVRQGQEDAVSPLVLGRSEHEAVSLKQFGASLERLRELLRTAPDVAVWTDRELLHWTAIVPSRNGEDEQCVSAATLADLVSQLETALTERAEAGRIYLRGTLDVLRMAWGTAFEIGWHGLWWYQRHDGTGGRMTAPTPEVLSRLMGEDHRERGQICTRTGT
jgi:hypothetical protein